MSRRQRPRRRARCSPAACLRPSLAARSRSDLGNALRRHVLAFVTGGFALVDASAFAGRAPFPAAAPARDAQAPRSSTPRRPVRGPIVIADAHTERPCHGVPMKMRMTRDPPGEPQPQARGAPGNSPRGRHSAPKPCASKIRAPARASVGTCTCFHDSPSCDGSSTCRCPERISMRAVAPVVRQRERHVPRHLGRRHMPARQVFRECGCPRRPGAARAPDLAGLRSGSRTLLDVAR